MPRKKIDIYSIFKNFPRSNLLEINKSKNFIKITNSDEYIIHKENDFIKINFYDFNKDLNNFEKKKNYIELFIHKDLNPEDFIGYWNNEEKNHYWYNFTKEYGILKKTFKNIKKIKISKKYEKDLRFQWDILIIKPKKLKEILKILEKTNKQINSARTSLETYLVNELKFKILNKITKDTTSITKGEFDFLVHRLNLSTKNSQEDFKRYLNKKDINALESLFDKMIKNEVFDEEYLRTLDNYFIKEKLEKIIKIWKRILSIKSENVKSKENKELINSIFWTDIWQLETVWQKYFEKYLLYLFFSYKKIVPKVELKNLENLDKQYPDFVWVNHYDGIDIIEIKTHLKNILVWDNSHKNFAFSSEMSKAIIQTINYIDAITDKNIKKDKDEKELLEYLHVEENLYRPKWIIIISSFDKICKNKLTADQKNRLKKDFTKLRNSIHNIQIFTFDEILQIAERYIQNIKKN